MPMTREQYIEALARGAIDFDEVRYNLDLGNMQPHTGASAAVAANDQAILRSGDPNAIGRRLDAILANRGASLDTHTLWLVENQVAGNGTVYGLRNGQNNNNGGSGSGGTGSGSGTGSGGDVDDDAFAHVQTVLDQYGLGSLATWAFEQLQAGRSADRILVDLRNRPEFGARFPAIAQRQAAGLTPISPAEYIAYEQQARQILQQFGLPEGFFDSRDDFTQFLANDVSVAELYERAQQGFQRVAYAPLEVRDAFAQFFGTQGDQALAAFFLDPERAAPLLKNMATEAEIGGAARQQQIVADLATARRLREMGVTREQAVQGFGQVRALDPLFAELADESEDFTAEGVGTSAVFGLSPEATRQLERRRRRRLAAFEGAGGAAMGQRGVAGLGVEEPVI